MMFSKVWCYSKQYTTKIELKPYLTTKPDMRLSSLGGNMIKYASRLVSKILRLHFDIWLEG